MDCFVNSERRVAWVLDAKNSHARGRYLSKQELHGGPSGSARLGRC